MQQGAARPDCRARPDRLSGGMNTDLLRRHAGRAELFAFLDELGIATSTVEHPPLFTVEQSQQLRGAIPGGHVKNLFLKDKKGDLYLVWPPRTPGSI